MVGRGVRAMALTPSQTAEITQQRDDQILTRRPVSFGAEELLFVPHEVLDHGFVRMVDYMGTDAAVVQAARVSYGRGTRRASDDAALIRYLMRHRHSTPFEMCTAKFHVKLPVFVARQWIRHRTASVNEISARYSILDKEFYIPEPEDLAVQSTVNRQGRGDVLDTSRAAEILCWLRDDAERNYTHYEDMLNENPDGTRRDPNQQGLTRELARINLTLNTYTQWYWSANLHNVLGFLALRADSHAQMEIRVYADVMLKMIAAWVPHTHSAFLEHRLQAVTFSATMMKVLRARLQGEMIDFADSGLSLREWTELQEKLHPTAE